MSKGKGSTAKCALCPWQDTFVSWEAAANTLDRHLEAAHPRGLTARECRACQGFGRCFICSGSSNK